MSTTITPKQGGYINLNSWTPFKSL